MDPDSCYQLIALAAALGLSAFFAAAETSLLSLSKYRLRHLAAELYPRAVLVSRLLDDSSRLYNTILVGNSVSIIAAAALGTVVAAKVWSPGKALAYAILFITVLVFVFGKIIPRVLAAKNPEKASFILIRAIFFLMVLFYPVVKLFDLFVFVVTLLIGGEFSSVGNGITEEEIIDLVAAGQEDGVIHREEETMIHGVFDFTDKMVKDVMVPRPDIVAVEENASLAELIEIIKEEKFSRIPVYEESIDNILGILHIKDLFIADARKQENISLKNYLRQTVFVPETKKINELFRSMKKEKIHMAVVLDEYGSTAGLVTLEDLIEEIMGEIQDEHDVEEPRLVKIDSDTIEVDASLRIDEINELLGLNLECQAAETVGGLVFTLLDRVPLEGDSVKLGDMEITVLLMDGHRIEKLRLTRLKLTQTEEGQQ